VTERADSVLTCGGRGRLGPCDRNLAAWHAVVATSRHDGRLWLENGLLSSRVAFRSQFVVWIRPHREPRGRARGCRGPSGPRRTWAVTSAGLFALRTSELPKPGSRIGGQPLMQLQDGWSERVSAPAFGNIGGHREETGVEAAVAEPSIWLHWRRRPHRVRRGGAILRGCSTCVGFVSQTHGSRCIRLRGLVHPRVTAFAPETIRCRRICLRIHRRGIRGPSPADGDIGRRAVLSGILGSRGLRVERVSRGGS